MIDLKNTLSKYKCEYAFVEDTGGQLDIAPSTNSGGLPITIYGSFAKDGLESVEIYGIQFAGYSEDVPAEEADEEKCVLLLLALLGGKYEYSSRGSGWLAKLLGQRIYLNVGDKNAPVIKDFKCTDQAGMRRLYSSNRLRAVAYEPI